MSTIHSSQSSQSNRTSLSDPDKQINKKPNNTTDGGNPESERGEKGKRVDKIQIISSSDHLDHQICGGPCSRGLRKGLNMRTGQTGYMDFLIKCPGPA